MNEQESPGQTNGPSRQACRRVAWCCAFLGAELSIGMMLLGAFTSDAVGLFGAGVAFGVILASIGFAFAFEGWPEDGDD